MRRQSVGNALRGVPRAANQRFLADHGTPQRGLPTALLVLIAFTASPTAVAAEGEVAKPAAIQTQDVPPIPAEFAARLSQYQNTRTAGFAGWSPDGKGMLIQTRFGNSTQLHRVYEPGGRREQITFFDEPASGRFLPKAKDGAIVVSMSRGGSENDQLYLLDRTEFRTPIGEDLTSARNELVEDLARKIALALESDF